MTRDPGHGFKVVSATWWTLAYDALHDAAPSGTRTSLGRIYLEIGATQSPRAFCDVATEEVTAS